MKYMGIAVSVVMVSSMLYAGDEQEITVSKHIYMLITQDGESKTWSHPEAMLQECSDPQHLKEVIRQQHAHIIKVENSFYESIKINEKLIDAYDASQAMANSLLQKLKKVENEVQFFKRHNDSILKNIVWSESKCKVMYQMIYMGMAFGCAYLAYGLYVTDRS